MRLLLAVMVFLAALPVMAQQPEVGSRHFESWMGECDADGYCVASSVAPWGAARIIHLLRIGRHAEQTYWELSLESRRVAPESALAFDIDGTVATFASPDEAAAFGRPSEVYLLGDKAQALLDRLVPGTALTVGFTDIDGSLETARFWLDGLAAALIWIDERQNRLGSERVTGPPPIGLARLDASGAPAIPPPLLAQHAADTDCRPIDDLAHGTDIEVDAALGGGATLYILPCWGAAYNFGWRAYVDRFGDGMFDSVALPEYVPGRGWTATTTLVNYSYDAATRTLSSFGRHRGIGDCGEQGTWQWHEYRFRLIEYRYKAECDGSEPGDFPVVYRLEEP